MKWITRERPKIDRIACPWLIRRFIDREAEIIFVPFKEITTKALELNGIPFDVPDVEFTHLAGANMCRMKSIPGIRSFNFSIV